MINRLLDKQSWKLNQEGEMVELYEFEINSYEFLLRDDAFINKTRTGKRITEAEIDRIMRDFSPDDYAD